MSAMFTRYTAGRTSSRAQGPSFTDHERYQWIRGHRGDFVIAEALAHSNRDLDFDTVIDRAIDLSRQGSRQSLAT